MEPYFWTASEVEAQGLRVPADQGRPAGPWGVYTITGWVYPPAAPANGSIAFYRFIDPRNGIHFYTADPGGEGLPAQGWKSEGVACYLPQLTMPGAVAFYRYLQPVTGVEHFYSRMNEVGGLNGYSFEGKDGGPGGSYGMFAAQTPGTVPFYCMTSKWEYFTQLVYARGPSGEPTGNPNCHAVRYVTGLRRDKVIEYLCRDLLGKRLVPSGDCPGGDVKYTWNYDALNIPS